MSTITITQLPNSGALTGAEVLPIVQSNTTVQTTVQAIAALAGLSGTNFIYVAADGTDTENATALSTAYTTAKTMSPGSANRITIIAAPGNYNFGSTTFELDTAYIDLVSLDGNRSIIFNSSDANGTIAIVGFSANNIYVKGVDVQNKPFKVEMYYNSIIVENCKGGNNSFSSADGFNIGGRFTDCEGGNGSFGGLMEAQGVFIRCKGGANSFSLMGTASGTFQDCVGGDNSFGNIASGVFTNCQAGDTSFAGSGGTASGTFRNCTAGGNSFGGTSFGGGVGITGTFSNCVGGPNSWTNNGNVQGKLYFSRMTAGGQTVPSTSQAGAIVAFITSVDDFIAQDPL